MTTGTATTTAINAFAGPAPAPGTDDSKIESFHADREPQDGRKRRRGRRGGRNRNRPAAENGGQPKQNGRRRQPPSNLGSVLLRAAGLDRADGAALLRRSRAADGNASYVRPDQWGFRLQAKRIGRELGRIDRRTARAWDEARKDAGDDLTDGPGAAALIAELEQTGIALKAAGRRLARLAETHRGVARRCRVRGNPGKAIGAVAVQAGAMRKILDEMREKAGQAESRRREALGAAERREAARLERAAVARMHAERAELERANAKAVTPAKSGYFPLREFSAEQVLDRLVPMPRS